MSSAVVVISPIDTLAHARNIMLRDRINRVVVVNNETKPVGILTRADMAREISSRPSRSTRSYDQVLVQQVMSKPLTTLKPSDAILLAAQTMLRRKISGMPIVDEDGSLVGVLSKSDIARFYADNCSGRVKVREVATHEVAAIPASVTLYRAEELMRKRRIGRLVVVNAKTPVGVVTQRDLSFAEYPTRGPQEKFRRVRTIGEGDHIRKIRTSEEATVQEVMSTPAVTITVGKDVVEAARLMQEKDIGGIPVVDAGGELVGIVTKTDIVKALIIFENRRKPTTTT